MTTKKWFSFILAGLVGQIAWALENMYFSTFAFYASENINFVTAMTALSAVTATVTTLLIGALSDRLGKRKPFISIGYIIWGISIIFFAFLDPYSSISIVNHQFFLAGTLIVIMDCVMTFFGSTANDACFNALVTDQTEPNIRGKVESILSVLPMAAMIIIVVLSGVFGADVNGGRWDIFFYSVGGLTSLIGIILLFLIDKDSIEPNKDEPYFKNIFYGFRPSVVKKNPSIYILYISMFIFAMAIQIFFPYLIIYVQKVLEITDLNFMITIGSVLVVASIITIIVGIFLDRLPKVKLLIPLICVTSLGAFLFFLARNMAFVIVSGIIMMSGYMICTAIYAAKGRDYTPDEAHGKFQGVRMIFLVMLPMVTGPYIGQALSLINEKTYYNDYGELVSLPNEYIFFGTAICVLLAIVPLIFLIRREKKDA